VRFRSVRAPTCADFDSYFLPFPERLAFDPAAASRRRLPILKRTTRGRRDLQAFAGPQVAAAAGAALMDLEPAEADEVHCFAFADGSFDASQRAAYHCLDHGFRLSGVAHHTFDQVSEKHDALPLLSLIPPLA
jgi:hypothetical protein